MGRYRKGGAEKGGEGMGREEKGGDRRECKRAEYIRWRILWERELKVM